mgnify:CR=1 FL=1
MQINITNEMMIKTKKITVIFSLMLFLITFIFGFTNVALATGDTKKIGTDPKGDLKKFSHDYLIDEYGEEYEDINYNDIENIYNDLRSDPKGKITDKPPGIDIIELRYEDLSDSGNATLIVQFAGSIDDVGDPIMFFIWSNCSGDIKWFIMGLAFSDENIYEYLIAWNYDEDIDDFSDGFWDELEIDDDIMKMKVPNKEIDMDCCVKMLIISMHLDEHHEPLYATIDTFNSCDPLPIDQLLLSYWWLLIIIILSIIAVILLLLKRRNNVRKNPSCIKRGIITGKCKD